MDELFSMSQEELIEAFSKMSLFEVEKLMEKLKEAQRKVIEGDEN